MTAQLVDVINDIHKDNQERDAFNSINGYFYQFELTLLHILTEGTQEDAFGESITSATYKVETIEDYVKYFDSGNHRFIRVAQIKHHSKGVTDSKYYDAVLWLYLNFLKFLQMNVDGNISYKAMIFQHDPNGEKDIQAVLKAAIDSYEKKRIKELEKIKKEGSGKTPKENVYDKISDTKIDTLDNRKKFFRIASFKATKSHEEISAELKDKLFSLYGMLKKDNTREFLYGAAITKLVEDGQKGRELTFQSLNAYFHGNPSMMDDFYIQKIIDFIFSIMNSNISDVEIEMGFNDLVTESYRHIYNDLMKPFMKTKLIEDKIRSSFLKSIVPKDIRNFSKQNTLEEYIAFVDCSSPIADFLSKLAKILYFHEKENNEVVKIESLDEWFEINENAWLFQYPAEKRGIGVITGDIFNKSFYGCLRHFLPRLKHKDIRPDVWYMGHNEEELTASQNLNYELDITLPKGEREQFTFCETEEDHFHIQCMGCLSVNKFEKINKVPNIFIDGCSVRGDNS